VESIPVSSQFPLASSPFQPSKSQANCIKHAYASQHIPCARLSWALYMENYWCYSTPPTILRLYSVPMLDHSELAPKL
jgi:hypothetical protein